MTNHGTWGAYKDGCRCADCREASRALTRRLRSARAERAAAGDPAVPHGYGGYVNWRCRCRVCTEANRLHAVALKAPGRMRGCEA